ncbi:hypothetical protein SAMN05519104_7948 [Rhizobiales bacterium GAS188]|nr:hypothetical protein SAMN05519104_7948 [Rhizobiales bacterium GAS188]
MLIIHHDPRERRRSRPPSDRNGGRLHVGTATGFRSESPAGFVGIRTVAVICTLGGQWPDREVGVTMNRMRWKPSDGKSWKTVRVRELRERLGDPAVRSDVSQERDDQRGQNGQPLGDLHRFRSNAHSGRCTTSDDVQILNMGSRLIASSLRRQPIDSPAHVGGRPPATPAPRSERGSSPRQTLTSAGAAASITGSPLASTISIRLAAPAPGEAGDGIEAGSAVIAAGANVTEPSIALAVAVLVSRPQVNSMLALRS